MNLFRYNKSFEKHEDHKCYRSNPHGDGVYHIRAKTDIAEDQFQKESWGLDIPDDVMDIFAAVRSKDIKYTFVTQQYPDVSHRHAWESRKFYICYDGEELGNFTYNTNHSNVKKFFIGSRLTEKIMTRVTAKSTNDIRTAVKLIIKYIKPVAMRERFDTLQRKVNQAAYQAVKNVSHMKQDHHNKDIKSLYGIMFTKHRDVALSLLQEVGKSEAEAKQMLDDYDSYQTLEAMREDVEMGKGVLVIKYSNNIYMDTMWARHSEMITLQHKDLSDTTKTNIAMLSVCNDDSAVTDIGIKIDNNQFYLITTEEMTNA
tara:strand:- start:317 stop:1258 length:942 start_codon:yes stop_codon:yes gene_type:complete